MPSRHATRSSSISVAATYLEVCDDDRLDARNRDPVLVVAGWMELPTDAGESSQSPSPSPRPTPA